MKDLGRFIVKRRAELGINQGHLSERAGISRPLISQIENGQKPLLLANIPRMARALEVPAATLAQLAIQRELDVWELPYRVEVR
jgi:transcriptional regulator with XRE-family HTH domain